jgi:hypothetical protein
MTSTLFSVSCMSRKISEEVQRQRTAMQKRVEWVLNHLFAGKQRRMAAAMRKSQAYLSRVVHGQQNVGPEFLEALSRLPGVNPRWVETGEGEPLLPPTHGTLPVASSILPAWPERCPELMSGERFPVAEAFAKPSRYWYRVELTCPALRATALALLPGDMLLLDADVTAWTDRLSDCAGKLFGVRVRRGEQSSYQLALLRRHPTGLSFDTFEERDRLSPPSPAPLPSASSKATDDEGMKRLPRKITKLIPASEKPAKKAKPADAAPTTTPSDVPFVQMTDIAGPGVVTPQDIVAIRVGLYRS